MAQQERSGPPPGAVVATVAVVVLLVGTIVALLVVGVDDGGGVFGGRAEPVLLDEDRMQGTVRGAGTEDLGRLPNPGGEATHAFSVHTQAGRIVVNLTWNATQFGSDELHAELQISEDGAWETMESRTGSSPIRFEHSGAGIAGSEMRVRVHVEGGAFEQPYAVHVEHWSY